METPKSFFIDIDNKIINLLVNRLIPVETTLIMKRLEGFK